MLVHGFIRKTCQLCDRHLHALPTPEITQQRFSIVQQLILKFMIVFIAAYPSSSFEQLQIAA